MKEAKYEKLEKTFNVDFFSSKGGCVAQTKALLFEKNSILFYNNFYNLLFASG
jgi:hypothetical protein